MQQAIALMLAERNRQVNQAFSDSGASTCPRLPCILKQCLSLRSKRHRNWYHCFCFQRHRVEIERSISIRTELLVRRMNVQNLASCCADGEYWLLNDRSALEFFSELIFLVWACETWAPRALKGPCESYCVNPTRKVWKIWKHTPLFLNEPQGLSVASLHFFHIFLQLSPNWLSVLYMVPPEF